MQLGEALLEDFFVGVELLDAQLGALGFFKVLVDVGGLRLAETDEVYDVREDFLQAWICWLVEIREGKVVD